MQFCGLISVNKEVNDSQIYQFQTIAANSNLKLIAFVSIDSVTKLMAVFENVLKTFFNFI